MNKATEWAKPGLSLSLPKVAILLCTYHGKDYLTDQLNSIAAQSHANWDVWASDDGSQDNTLPILESFRKKWGCDRLSILSGPAKGFVANFLSLTCNPNVRADYYAYADQDDIWNADKLENAVNWLKTIPPDVPALFCTRTRLIDSQDRCIGHSPLRPTEPNFANALIQSLAGGNTMVFNNAARQLVSQTGHDVEVVSHDWWLYILVTGCGGKVKYDACPSLLYRQHSANVVGLDASWPARFARVTRLFYDFYKHRNDLNIMAVQKARPMLTSENQRILDLFSAARSKWLLPRLIGIKKSGVHCQSRYGNLGLIVAAVFKKF